MGHRSVAEQRRYDEIRLKEESGRQARARLDKLEQDEAARELAARTNLSRRVWALERTARPTQAGSQDWRSAPASTRVTFDGSSRYAAAAEAVFGRNEVKETAKARLERRELESSGRKAAVHGWVRLNDGSQLVCGYRAA
jgi:hypothetical protein